MEWLNYHHLYYFWITAREGSISRAGEHLRLAPSTISAQITKFEGVLEGKLFRRVGRNLEPTEMGRIVFRYADKIFSLGHEMLDTVRGRPVSGPLRLVVGTVAALPKLVVRKLLEPAIRLPQQVRMICHEGREEQLLAELSVHGLDIVLTDTPVKPGLSVKAYSHLLGECGISFFGTRRLADGLPDNFPLSLDGTPMLLPSPMSALRGSLDRWFDSLPIRPAVVGEFDDQALLKTFGQAGDGIFAAPTVIEEEVQRQHDVVVIGRTRAVREQFFAISIERVIKHPAVAAIQKAASSYFIA
ncbi:MAG: transcriptional activator NhaR [Desulfobulbaceae bacterium]|nr:transcriptional activator NhaR [Desulfobulbaceae bacterium]